MENSEEFYSENKTINQEIFQELKEETIKVK